MSSPILVGDTVYTVSEDGDLYAVDANSGAIKWKLKLGIDERNACPLFADGKLYVPILDDPASQGDRRIGCGDDGGLLHHPPGREGRRDALPRSAGGPMFRHARWPITASFTCRPRVTFIAGERRATTPAAPRPPEEKPWPAAGPATQLQVIPSEVLLHPGEQAAFRVRSLDANGFTVQESIPAKRSEVGELHAPDREGEGGAQGRFRCGWRASGRARSRPLGGRLRGHGG